MFQNHFISVSKWYHSSGYEKLGIAYANNKRCYGIKIDVRSFRKDLDINPMLSECFIKIFKDSDGDSLIKTLKEYLSKNDL